MRTTRFSEEQIIGVLKEADAASAAGTSTMRGGCGSLKIGVRTRNFG